MSRVHTPHHLAVAVLSTIATLSAPTASTAQPTTQAFDRTRPPALGAAPTLTVPRVQSGTLANGPVIRLVEQRELPLVQIQGHGIGRIGLNLQGMGASFGCSLDNF